MGVVYNVYISHNITYFINDSQKASSFVHVQIMEKLK